MWFEAAALLQSVIGKHTLVDGNKRLDWRSVAVFLEINDVSVATASNEDVDASVMEVAQRNVGLDDLAERLCHLTDRGTERGRRVDGGKLGLGCADRRPTHDAQAGRRVVMPPSGRSGVRRCSGKNGSSVAASDVSSAA